MNITKLIENMVYKNFFLRIIFSFFFIFLYVLIFYINFTFIFYIIFLLYILIIFEIYLNFKKYKFIPIIYVLISFIFFLSIDFNDQIFLSFNLYIFIVICFDIFSYIFGKLYGNKKLIKLSPNKTVEGFVGGLITTFIASIFLSYFLNFRLDLNTLFFIALIIFSAFAGDIFESYFKRKNILKNSSELIPGHGGIFDRFDSFLFSIIFYSIFIKILI